MADNNDKVLESRRRFLRRGKEAATAALALGTSGMVFSKGRMDAAADLKENLPDAGRRTRQKIKDNAQQVQDENEKILAAGVALTTAGGAGMVAAFKNAPPAAEPAPQGETSLSRRNLLKYAPAAAGAALAVGGMEKALYGLGDFSGTVETLSSVPTENEEDKKTIEARMRSADKRAAGHIKDGSTMIMGAGTALVVSSAFVLREAAKKKAGDKDDRQR